MADSPTMILGIDMSKATFDVALLTGDKRPKTAKFSNGPDGFAQLQQWLLQHGAKRVHACMEATNIYGHALATTLYEQGDAVSIVNPSRIKGYAQSQLSRTKNDRADAGLIARFCRDLKPSLWHPSPTEVAQMQALSRRLGALEQMATQEKNRLQLTADPELIADIEAHIAFLEEQAKGIKKRLQEHIQTNESLAYQHRLLGSIIGIAETTATNLLAEIGRIDLFHSARQLAAFAGLTPQERTSGSSVNGKTRLCKIGNPRLRKTLYFPALTAIRYCPPIKDFYQSLLAAGKTKMQGIGAVMHKLLRIVYGVLKSGKPFDLAQLSPQIP